MGDCPELGDALWDLVWAGEVTNDSLHAVRALLAPLRRARRNSSSTGRAMHLRSLERFTVRDDVAGRWSLTEAAGDAPITHTERATAQIRQLLERHGVLTREVVRSEGVGGGFAAAYGVLKAMEDAGRIRRGYFVAGLGAAQFALPGAVDRLRVARERPEEPHAVVLAATDPRILWRGLPGGRPEGRKPMRMAGALVIIVDGRLRGAGRARSRGSRSSATRRMRAARAALAGALAGGEVGPEPTDDLYIQTVEALRSRVAARGRLARAGFARRRAFLRRVSQHVASRSARGDTIFRTATVLRRAWPARRHRIRARRPKVPLPPRGDRSSAAPVKAVESNGKHLLITFTTDGEDVVLHTHMRMQAMARIPPRQRGGSRHRRRAW